MALHYKKIGMTARTDLEGRDAVVREVADIVQKAGAHVFLDAQRCDIASVPGAAKYDKIQNIDLLIVLGGDGTILRAVREIKDFSIPILSVHRGRVGFLAETALEDARELLPKLLSGDGEMDERQLLSVAAKRGNETLWSGHVLNEAVISQGAIARLIDLTTRINGEELTTFHADGLIIASPTGSTAYSLSAGGPIVHPSLPSMILTPINPHSFSQKPIVVPANFVVETDVLSRSLKYDDIQLSLTLDGQIYVTLQSGDTLTVACNGATVKFLRRKQDTFFHTLREKLKWGESAQD